MAAGHGGGLFRGLTVSSAAAATGSRVMDHPFTLIEMRMKPNEKGEERRS